ncbi:molybdopterin-guanine dinucleotide biosynthesis protein B [Campylobacter helveticus]|uniref:Molybdopterin-guanine dinucleotide biosynthesis protein B n=1 Tax=Campylobacter helveticus TaxID=28898 RepID=A0AAX2UIW8_9BACT|nr:molybdopterin-guanine dinucleotide biosynthesis protein B [Campylobacter helveticus]ARE80513.1 molybdenum cofactor guanylyltransferase protein B [Campylobacter helveticus]MCR2040060.1 molybdopterin-guanine dinucleotide biosynthesis protein B [Campylobacter helveticus]MCR2055100.1 molybdopterin-guanine dinucleotide biosynthesis protein B [Campylobacter helveticus]MCR2057307.1 molybdopterin-guanine dinucleotide biosynthesis protein B [Campylobacter helveticus]MCR2060883.1 molybdopterin-guanin
MKQLIMAFSGPSNSGKTTLIEKLVRYFTQKGLKVLVIKHDPADKARFDVEGKDSFKFFQSGAETIILSPSRTTLFSHEKRDIFDALRLVEFDLCLVEGLKSLNLPRISVFCKEIDTSYFSFSNAIASYEKISYENLVWLDLNNLEQIASFILNNALKGEFSARVN